MENVLASPNLALVSYRIATDPNYAKELTHQIEAGKIDGGQAITMEEETAMLILLHHNHPSQPPGKKGSDGPASGTGTWIG
jgi:hypothetical protein